jgi:hypothetical protein
VGAESARVVFLEYIHGKLNLFGNHLSVNEELLIHNICRSSFATARLLGRMLVILSDWQNGNEKLLLETVAFCHSAICDGSLYPFGKLAAIDSTFFELSDAHDIQSLSRSFPRITFSFLRTVSANPFSA